MADTEPLASQPQNLREAVFIALDEMLKALAECFWDLSHEQLWFEGPENRNRIGCMLLHVQQNMDCHACYFQIGQWALDYDERFDFYGKPPLRFEPEEELPGPEELRSRHETLRAQVFAGLRVAATDEELHTPRFAEQEYWWQQHGRRSIDAYWRVIGHAQAHIRQIWLARGRMGACGDDTWPVQFYH